MAEDVDIAKAKCLKVNDIIIRHELLARIWLSLKRGLRTAGCVLRAAGCGLRAADCGLRAADCGL